MAVLFWEPHVDDVGDSSVAPIVEGVCRRLEGTSYTAMIQLLLPGMEGLDRVSRIVEGKLADGIILSGTTPQDERVRYMLERRFPFVTFGRTELFTPHPWYDIDNELAAWQATSHLAQEGRRRIALIDPPRHLTFAQHRLLGYRRALAEAGLRFDPALVVQGGLGAAESRAADPAPRGLAQPADRHRLCHRHRRHGRAGRPARCRPDPRPRRGVVSRDGTRLADYLHPPLPTCFVSLSETGWQLCDFLLRAIDGAPPEELQQLVATTLVLPGDPLPDAMVATAGAA